MPGLPISTKAVGTIPLLLSPTDKGYDVADFVGVVVDGGFDPEMLDLDVADLATALHRAHRDAARGGIVGGGEAVLKTSGPVVGACGEQFDGAVDVARVDAGGTQQRKGQAGDIHSVAPLCAQSQLGVLHRSPGGNPLNVVAYPMADLHRVVVQLGGLKSSTLTVVGMAH
jgi:hypothetical protein